MPRGAREERSVSRCLFQCQGRSPPRFGLLGWVKPPVCPSIAVLDPPVQMATRVPGRGGQPSGVSPSRTALASDRSKMTAQNLRFWTVVGQTRSGICVSDPRLAKRGPKSAFPDDVLKNVLQNGVFRPRFQKRHPESAFPSHVFKNALWKRRFQVTFGQRRSRNANSEWSFWNGRWDSALPIDRGPRWGCQPRFPATRGPRRSNGAVFGSKWP